MLEVKPLGGHPAGVVMVHVATVDMRPAVPRPSFETHTHTHAHTHLSRFLSLSLSLSLSLKHTGNQGDDQLGRKQGNRKPKKERHRLASRTEDLRIVPADGIDSERCPKEKKKDNRPAMVGMVEGVVGHLLGV